MDCRNLLQIMHNKIMYYLGLIAQIAAQLPDILEDGNIVLSAVIPKLWGRKFLLQNTSCTCDVTTEEELFKMK